MYPVSQPMVSSVEVSTSDIAVLYLYDNSGNSVAAEPFTLNSCIVKLNASDQDMWYEGIVMSSLLVLAMVISLMMNWTLVIM